MAKHKIFLIDGHNFLYRLFYAVPAFSSKDGIPVNAVFGVARMVLEWQQKYSPNQVVFIFDAGHRNFRHDLYAQYKGTRDRMPDALRIQEGIIYNLLEKMWLDVIRYEWYEADDVIGSLVTYLRTDSENDISILSGDKDLTQLVGGNVTVYEPVKRQILGKEAIKEKFGVEAGHIADYLAICGDTSDNIPGVPGLGPKKASTLINTYGTLEEIYEHLNETDTKSQNLLTQYREQAFLSKTLATICTTIPPEDILLHIHDDFAKKQLLTEEVIAIFQKYDFRSLLPKEAFTSLQDEKVDLCPVLSSLELQKLSDDIFKNKKVSLGVDAPRKKAYFSLGKEVFEIDFSLLHESGLVQKLLSADIEIIGYGIKDDIRSLLLAEMVAGKQDEEKMQLPLF